MMLRVSEIFHSIQGESTRAGLPCVFIRLAGCNLRCVWCDTAYALHEGTRMSVGEIVDEVARFDCRLVEVTGGEPLLQTHSIELMEELLTLGYRVLLETGGSLPIDRVPNGVVRIVDLKCPGSGEAERNRWDNVELLTSEDELKFVVADREDYLWASRQVRERDLAGRCAVLFSPVHGKLEAGRLADWILEDRLPVRVQIQLHKLLWSARDRGA